MTVIRTLSSFKVVFKKRTVIERFFSIIEDTHRLLDVRFKGIINIGIHVIFVLLSYLSRFIG
ncbi:hypothetical protein J7K43_07300 [Candidatus Calescamantes bacterium]|nr:hypothetical protein [Candidatus Calescamantes bacterium]